MSATPAEDDALERLVTEVPGPRSRGLAARLRVAEMPGITYLADDLPVFWESASGATVCDVDGNRFLDLTSAFGVALSGHANPEVARALAAQAAALPHAMGDVHPAEIKVRLLERLRALAPVDDGRVFLCSSGSESIEFARKAAALATGENAALAFAGSYHGLSYGALEVGGIGKFRTPFAGQLRGDTSFVRFPDGRDPGDCEKTLALVRKALRKDRRIGAIVVEPIQGRAGVIVPPEGFLAGLRALASEFAAVLVVDEIYTGFGRTGRLFACEYEDVRPDILCAGKALGGGAPISAAVVAGEVATSWPPSSGEALHTSTYLGNPLGCAAALANLERIDRLELVRVARERGPALGEALHALEGRVPQIADVRGRGMLWALEFREPALAHAVLVEALRRGLILLQSGIRGESLTLAPPLVISERQLARACELLAAATFAAVEGR
ncbi:MAG: aspartate aminotransferase family protein [Vulcanimicrobiaceae bacterium]